jgi:6-phosphogluconolactonase (cycloisomerase 2 family)
VGLVRLVRPFLLLAALLTLSAPGIGQASAAGGGLRFVECLSGTRPERGEPRTARAGGCTPSATATLEGQGSGLDSLTGLAASPDGRSLYAVSGRDDSLAAFTAAPLRMTECFTTKARLRGHGKQQPCEVLPDSGGGTVGGALKGVHFAAVSPDGQNVYTVGEGSIATFARDPSGRLTFAGAFSGFAAPRSLAISPDGRFVYVALGSENGIATLARAADGSLQLVSRSGLPSPVRVVISADGTSLYATPSKGASIAEFRIDPAIGTLTYSGCLSAARRGAGSGLRCRYVPQATAKGYGTSLYEMREIAISPDGTGLYGVSTYDNSVAAFDRDPATGTLTFTSCIDAESTHASESGLRDPCTSVPSVDRVGNGSGLYEPRGLAISPDGRNLFVGSHGDATINRFRLTPDGGLHLAGCVTEGNGRGTRCTRARAPGGELQLFGFDGFNSLVVTGHALYAAAGDGSALSRFSFP